MPELILGIDVGTTSTRAAVVTPDGRFAGLASAALTSSAPLPGRVEQDAEAVWRATLDVVFQALDAAGREPRDIAAIGVTTQRTSAVVWDRASGAPLTPLVVWSDLRGTERGRELGGAGFMLAPQQAATKLESMFAGVAAPPSTLAWGNIDSYLIFRLAGGAAHVTDRSQAWLCGYLGLPDLGWNMRLVEHQGLDLATFPALADTWGEMGVTSPAVFGAAVPIAADIADQQSALLAHGGAPGTAKFTFGTAGAFDIATGGTFLFPGPSTPPLIVSSVAGETRFCVEGMVLSAGSAVDWLRQALALGDHAAFERLAGQVGDTAGATFLPAMQGLGAPRGDPSRRASLTGLSASVERTHLARAALEGVAFRAREILDHIYAATELAPPPALGIDGGLSRSRQFLQILADLSGRPVRRHATPEATLLGAAIAAGRGTRVLSEDDIVAMIRFEPSHEPRLSPDEADARFAAWRAQVYGSGA
jgi:glycerol kinase